MLGKEHPSAAVLQPLVAGWGRKRRGVTVGQCTALHAQQAVLCVAWCHGPRHTAGFEPTALYLQRLHWSWGLILIPAGGGQLFPVSASHFGSKEEAAAMVTRQKSKHISRQLQVPDLGAGLSNCA